MKLLKGLLAIAFISVMAMGSSFAAEAGYDQDNDTMETVARIGFTSPTKLTFTETAVDFILDPKFDPSRGANVETRHAKTFLLETLRNAIKLSSERFDFRSTLAASFEYNKNQTEIDIGSVGYDLSIYPSRLHTKHAAELLIYKISSDASTVAFRLSIVDESGRPFFASGANPASHTAAAAMSAPPLDGIPLLDDE